MTDPLVFFYGQLSPGDNPKLFNVVVDNLAATVEQRFASDSVGASQNRRTTGQKPECRVFTPQDVVNLVRLARC